MILFRATLEGRTAIKKNGKSVFVKNGRAIITTSQNYKSWERTATLSLLSQKNAARLIMPIDIPINLECRFYFPNHQWESDLSNLIQGPEDILQSTGIIENDSLIYSLDGSRKIFGADRFHMELVITPHIPEKPLHFLPAIE